jgi:hypothetical protein
MHFTFFLHDGFSYFSVPENRILGKIGTRPDTKQDPATYQQNAYYRSDRNPKNKEGAQEKRGIQICIYEEYKNP